MITCSSTLEIVLGSSLSKSTKAACLRDILSPGQSKLKVINPLRQKTLKPRERIYIPPSTQKSIISHQMGKIMRKHPDSHQLKSQLLGYLSSPLTPVFFIPTIIPFQPLTSVFWRWTMMHPKNEPRVLAWQKTGGFVWCVSGATKNQPPS